MRFFFQGTDLMFRLRDGGEKIALFYEGNFIRAMLEGNFEVNLNGWSPDEVVESMIEEGLLPEFFPAAKEAYANLWWACNSAQKAGANVDAAYNAAVNALAKGDIDAGTPLYVAKRCDVSLHDNNPFGNEEDFGGDRWAAKGSNTMSHRDHFAQFASRRRVAGTDLPPGVRFRDVAVIIAGVEFKINKTDFVDVEKINTLWDRESNFFTHI